MTSQHPGGVTAKALMLSAVHSSLYDDSKFGRAICDILEELLHNAQNVNKIDRMACR
jgi:high-affinity K+ transport system ATPase subunit B